MTGCWICGQPATRPAEPMFDVATNDDGSPTCWTQPTCDKHRFYLDQQHAPHPSQRRRRKKAA